MLERGRGKVIFTASLLSFQGGILVPGYTASKSALAGLVRALSNEWAGARRERERASSPGYIATDNTEALRDDPERNRAILERIPAGRWGEAHRSRRGDALPRVGGLGLRLRRRSARRRRLARAVTAAGVLDAVCARRIVPGGRPPRASDAALPLARALAEGGLPVAEVTFRTEAAAECDPAHRRRDRSARRSGHRRAARPGRPGRRRGRPVRRHARLQPRVVAPLPASSGLPRDPGRRDRDRGDGRARARSDPAQVLPGRGRAAVSRR